MEEEILSISCPLSSPIFLYREAGQREIPFGSLGIFYAAITRRACALLFCVIYFFFFPRNAMETRLFVKHTHTLGTRSAPAVNNVTRRFDDAERGRARAG